ncbi:MAG: hypothetical protein ABFS86_13335 [Planctomycetota bacterium]
MELIPIGRLTRDVPSRGETQPDLIVAARKVAAGEIGLLPHRPRVRGERLHLGLGRQLARWRGKSGAGVFELLSRVLASAKAGFRLGEAEKPFPVVMLESSDHLVVVTKDAIGLSRAALRAPGLRPRACLVAVLLAHGLRAAARLRADGPVDEASERVLDVKNLLLLLVGVLGTEWDPAEVADELTGLIDPSDPLVPEFRKMAEKLSGSLSRRESMRLDDRVFRDGALFDGLPRREKWRVIAAGTLAWYGMLTLGLLRLPRRFFARKNPYYETAWWIFRAKPGGRGLFKPGLLRKAMQRFASLRILSGMEYLWSAYSPTLAETCLRPVYRLAGGNRRPFVATIATYTYTALVIHPLWVTLLITGSAWALGHVWPAIDRSTKIASKENLILHAIVIGWWMGVGLVVAVSKGLKKERGRG